MRELCTYLLAQRRTHDALEVIQKVIAANPADEARYRLGAGLLRSHGQIDLAAEIYRQGRKAIGREGIFATELAQMAEGRGDYETAISEYLLLVMDPEQRPRAPDEEASARVAALTRGSIAASTIAASRAGSRDR